MTYTKYSRIITEILKEEVPLLEKKQVLMNSMPTYQEWINFWMLCYASELRRKIIHETGLPYLLWAFRKQNRIQNSHW